MRNERLFGPLLLLAGSTLLILPQSLAQQTGLAMTRPEAILASAALMLAGLLLIALGWRNDLARASCQGWAALRQATIRSAGNGPAKRMKIRIRCAR